MAAANVERKFDFVVVGGGIAGVSCTEYLSTLNGENHICLISGTDLVKSVSNVKKLSQTLEEYDVTEQPLHALVRLNVTVVKATVVNFNPEGLEFMLFLSCTNIIISFRHYRLEYLVELKPQISIDQEKVYVLCVQCTKVISSSDYVTYLTSRIIFSYSA